MNTNETSGTTSNVCCKNWPRDTAIAAALITALAVSILALSLSPHAVSPLLDRRAALITLAISGAMSTIAFTVMTVALIKSCCLSRDASRRIVRPELSPSFSSDTELSSLPSTNGILDPESIVPHSDILKTSDGTESAPQRVETRELSSPSSSDILETSDDTDSDAYESCISGDDEWDCSAESHCSDKAIKSIVDNNSTVISGNELESNEGILSPSLSFDKQVEGYQQISTMWLQALIHFGHKLYIDEQRTITAMQTAQQQFFDALKTRLQDDHFLMWMGLDTLLVYVVGCNGAKEARTQFKEARTQFKEAHKQFNRVILSNRILADTRTCWPFPHVSLSQSWKELIYDPICAHNARLFSPTKKQSLSDFSTEVSLILLQGENDKLRNFLYQCVLQRLEMDMCALWAGIYNSLGGLAPVEGETWTVAEAKKVALRLYPNELNTLNEKWLRAGYYGDTVLLRRIRDHVVKMREDALQGTPMADLPQDSSYLCPLMAHLAHPDSSFCNDMKTFFANNLDNGDFFDSLLIFSATYKPSGMDSA